MFEIESFLLSDYHCLVDIVCFMSYSLFVSIHCLHLLILLELIMAQASEQKNQEQTDAYEVDIVKLWGYAGTDDNYAYFIIDKESSECMVWNNGRK